VRWFLPRHRRTSQSGQESGDDLAPPIIRISPDGQMAYVVVQKRVRLTAPDSAGEQQPEHTV